MDFDDIARRQGWNGDSMLMVARDFIQSKNLDDELAAYAAETAEQENREWD